jgi:L-ascorbate 6-phosphate lactonase
MLADPAEVIGLWEARRNRMRYSFRPLYWLPGGRFAYPQDIDEIEYYHDRGFEDHHTHPTNLPYKSFL